jgi:hypothetical protein
LLFSLPHCYFFAISPPLSVVAARHEKPLGGLPSGGGRQAPEVKTSQVPRARTNELNTGGGQISAGQAACSSHNLIEAVRQLRGEAGKRQVKNTRNALVTGIGWINYGRNWGSSAALVLVPE